jgi:FKBP-type peptidyl-prolyl cis-trans isomerase FkpA
MLRKALFLFCLVVMACDKDEPEVCTQTISSTVWTSLNQTQLTSDIQAIDDHLVSISKTAMEDESGLRYIITQQGTGETPCLESNIKVTYTGVFLSNSNVFDEATGARFTLSNLITGWRIAFLKFNRGTKATLYIPSGLAYGSTARSGIPANSNLIFFVELTDF